MPRPRTPFASWLIATHGFTPRGASSYVSHARLLLKNVPEGVEVDDTSLSRALAARPPQYQSHARAAWIMFRRYKETEGIDLPPLPSLVREATGFVQHPHPPDHVRDAVRALRACRISLGRLTRLTWGHVMPIADTNESLITVQTRTYVNKKGRPNGGSFGWRVPTAALDVLAEWGGSRAPDAPLIPGLPGSPLAMHKAVLQRATAGT